MKPLEDKYTVTTESKDPKGGRLLPSSDDPDVLSAEIGVMNAYVGAAMGLYRPGSITQADRRLRNALFELKNNVKK